MVAVNESWDGGIGGFVEGVETELGVIWALARAKGDKLTEERVGEGAAPVNEAENVRRQADRHGRFVHAYAHVLDELGVSARQH